MALVFEAHGADTSVCHIDGAYEWLLEVSNVNSVRDTESQIHGTISIRKRRWKQGVLSNVKCRENKTSKETSIR